MRFSDHYPHHTPGLVVLNSDCEHPTAIKRHMKPFQTFTWRADYTHYNAAYHTLGNHDSCDKCLGAGGFVGYEWQGDGAMGGMVNTFDVCDNCIGSELCPGCMQPLALSFDLSAFGAVTRWIAYNNPYYATNLGYLMSTFDYIDAISALPTDSFTCLVCGWSYDPDRHYDHDDYDDDYPALDASGYFGGL